MVRKGGSVRGVAPREDVEKRWPSNTVFSAESDHRTIDMQQSQIDIIINLGCRRLFFAMTVALGFLEGAGLRSLDQSGSGGQLEQSTSTHKEEL